MTSIAIFECSRRGGWFDNSIFAKIAEKQYILIAMLQQQIEVQAPSCPGCLRQQEIIDKYVHLVSLLKKKTQRRQDSKLSNVTGSQITLEQITIGYALRGQTLTYLIQKIALRRLRQVWTKITSKKSHERLAFTVSQSAIRVPEDQQKKIHDAKSLGMMRSCVSVLRQFKGKSECSSMDGASANFLEELFKSNSRDKLLLKKVYSLQLEKTSLCHKISSMEASLAENIRRQEKEIAKKRESLQGLADELLQKNDLIEELKETIKSLENKLIAKDDRAVHRMLEEDGDSMRRVVLKLENVNDKLNHDISKLKEEKNELQLQNRQISKTNESLNIEMKKFKEELFSHQHEKKQADLLRHELQVASRKMALKMDRIKKLERKLNEVSKVRDSVSTEAIDSSKKLPIESTLNVLQRSEEMREIDMDSKLESVFTYLFNIQHEDYLLHSAQLFDDDEKELLKTHKSIFLNLSKVARDDSIYPTHRRSVEDKENVCFGESILDVFQEPSKVTAQAPIQNNIKLIEMEIEKGKLIQKVTELKERYLHMRCVILQLLKSMDMRGAKKQAQGIFTVLCDIFEYSQEEREVMLQQRPRKFLGVF